MTTRFPQRVRRPEIPFGSASLAVSQRLAAGSVWASDTVSIVRDDKKTFGFRASSHGSFWIQASFLGTVDSWFNYAEGTFPGGQGSLTVRSFTEALQSARLRLSLTNTGSFSAYYGGFAPRRA